MLSSLPTDSDSLLTGTHLCELPRPCQRKGCTNMHFSFLPSASCLTPKLPLRPRRFAGMLWLPAQALTPRVGQRQAGCRALDSGMHFLLEVPRPNLSGF